VRLPYGKGPSLASGDVIGGRGGKANYSEIRRLTEKKEGDFSGIEQKRKWEQDWIWMENPLPGEDIQRGKKKKEAGGWLANHRRKNRICWIREVDRGF